MDIAISLHRNRVSMLRWYRVRKIVFLNSKIRAEVSGYKNYVRIIGLGVDFNLEWN